MRHRISRAKSELCRIQIEQKSHDDDHAQFQRHQLLYGQFQGLIHPHLIQLSMMRFFDHSEQHE